ncbi:MAG: ABC transporter substrate-binding protein [Thiobacillaceae bacterium]
MSFRSLFTVVVATVSLAACGQTWNDPYPKGNPGAKIFYTVFTERPKHLDPARSYSSNEVEFTGQVYEPPLQYHYLKRPYALEPLAAESMPLIRYWDASGHALPAGTPPERIARATYDIRIKSGIRYQPHPAFAQLQNGQPRYLRLSDTELNSINTLKDFKFTGTRELTADDYVYEIKRLASPQINSPIFGLMAEYIDGLDQFNAQVGKAADKLAKDAWLDLRPYDVRGVRALDRYTFRITLKAFYPQFIYWLAMPFFAPVPWEAERFYAQPGMAERNLNLDWFPVGTGPFLLSENDPNRRMVLDRNPNFHGESYPTEGEPNDKVQGLLKDAGKPLPLLDGAVFTLEKEDIPQWTKFLQGYYDVSGIGSDNFDQAVRFSPQGAADLSPEMKHKGIKLVTAITTSIQYMGFNMRDPVVGGLTDRARKLRQAISIAVDYEEFISIFVNGRGIPAQGPLPPGIFGYRDSPNPIVYTPDGKRRGLDEAKRLLAEAGYPNGRDEKTGRPLVLYFDTAATGPDAKSRLEWLDKQFHKLDIQLVIRATDYNTFQDKMLKGNAQIFEWGWNADYPDPENFLFLLYGPNAKVGKNGENAANYDNPEFDRLFTQMKALPNGPERQAIIDQMINLVRNDAPWLFGFIPKGFSLQHGWVANIKPNLMANNTLKYRSINPQLRRGKQAEWNRPAYWPFALLVATGFALVWPAWRQYRKQESAH